MTPSSEGSWWSSAADKVGGAASGFWEFVSSPIKSTVGAVAKDAGEAVGDVLSGFTPTLILLIVLGVVVLIIMGRVR